MHIERSELRTLAAVIAAGGFSRAAERLGVSQSAVSQAIANLEHKLGTQLLRRGSPPKLTEAGERLLSHATTTLADEATTLAEIEAIRTGARSTLSLALSVAVSRRHGAALLGAYAERNPLTRLKVDVVPSREIVHGVADGRWEIGFGPFLHQMPAYFAQVHCFEETRQLLVGNRQPECGRSERELLAFLKSQALITSWLEEPAPRGRSLRLRDYFGVVWEVGDLALRTALVAAGRGVTYASSLIVDELEGLRPIEGLPFSRIPRSVGVYYLRHQPLSQAGARFAAYCRERWPVPATPT